MLKGLFLMAEAAEELPSVLGIFIQSVFVQFILILAFLGIVYMMIQRARAGLPVPEIRKIPGLDALDEAVGRATEMGRPVHITPGLGGVGSAETLAFYALLGHVAKLTAKYDTRLIQTNRNYLIYPIAEEIIRQAYLEAGRPDAFNADDVMWLSDWQWSYTAAVMGIFRAERPAANIMFGYFYAESMILAEVGNQVGAIQVAGTTSTSQLPFFVAGCDYTLIGEEIYAASAYVSKEPVLTGTVVGQDWGKVFVFAMILVGTVIANFSETNIIKDILNGVW